MVQYMHMSAKPASTTTDDLTLKQAFEELETITATLEKGDSDLEKSIPQLKRGHELALFLKSKLKDIENQIEEVTVSFEDNDND
jgi:exodeoxyribonuclease VII small subunit